MSVRKYSASEITGVIARRRWHIVVPFAVGLALAPLLARYAPERYRSEALIVVIPQQVPDDYVKPTVSESVEERLPSITDQILSRSRLELIIQEMDLYPAARARGVMEDVVQRMRSEDITTTAVGREVDSFRISYVSDNPETARKVTERLASLYIDQNSKDRESHAQNTSEFLDTQLAQAKRRLVEQEKRLEDYRKSHSGQLPSQLQGNLQAIQNANLQMQALNESTNRAQERRLLVERQLADALTLPVVSTPVAVAGDAPAPVTAAQQLEVAQARRNFLLQRYTSDHPEIASLERTIAELTIKAEGEAALTARQPAPERPLTQAEAAQQKRIKEFQAELEVIDYQLTANKAEDARLKQTIAEYQAKVDAVPTRESELVELTRDYSTMQAAYASLLMKREESVIAANLERRQIGEQFRLVDVASRPERPDNQFQRLGIMASGALAGLICGVLTVLLLEHRDSSFRRADEVVATLRVPVFASIPAMVSEQEFQVARRRRLAIDAAGTAILLTAAAVVVLWRIQS